MPRFAANAPETDWMGNHPGGPVLYAWESQVGIVFYISDASLLCDRMWAQFQSISTCLGVFSLYSGFFSSLSRCH